MKTRIMLIGLALAGCNDFIEIEVDGRPVTVHYVTADVQTSDEMTTLIWRGHSDPYCDAIDDERTYEVQISIPDIQAVPRNTPIELSEPDGPLSVRLTGSCFCGFEEGEVEAVYSGTVQFDTLVPSAATGSLDIRVEGDIEFADTGGILHENSSAVVNVPFEAPRRDSHDCG